jgi:hypothetical protein
VVDAAIEVVIDADEVVVEHIREIAFAKEGEVYA